MKGISEWLSERKDESRKKREKDLMERVHIRDRHGALWLVCDDVAVRRIPEDMSVSEALALLSDARNDLLTYESPLV